MKQQFIDAMKTKGYDAGTAVDALKTLTDLIHTEIAVRDGRCVLQDVGVFRRDYVAARRHHNPRKPEEVVVKPAHYTVRFSPSKSFLQSLPTPA